MASNLVQTPVEWVLLIPYEIFVVGYSWHFIYHVPHLFFAKKHMHKTLPILDTLQKMKNSECW
jgi:hypothetical protein